MILTAVYVYATFQQSWRISSICSKIAEKIREKTSIVFYVIKTDINDAATATSELCHNAENARICDFLWLRDNKRGCCLVPKQIVHLGPWVSFPLLPSLIPITMHYDVNKCHQIDDRSKIHLLLETEIIPNYNAESFEINEDAIKVEEFGKPIAWKIDSNLAILLETDLVNFTKLLMSTFLRDRLIINDNLPLIRIESLNYEGVPQHYDDIKSHIQKHMTSRTKPQLSRSEWKKHIECLRGLSVLANQATEYEYKRNRTEGKTGIVKADLLPSKSFENLSVSPKNASTPVKSIPVSPQISEAPTEILVSPKRKLSTISNTTPVNTLNSTNVTPNHSPKKKSTQSSPLKEPSNETALKKVICDTPTKLSVPKSLPKSSKPPNILIYSHDSTVFESVLKTLKKVLEQDMYTIYPLKEDVAETKVWMESTYLLVVCGPLNEILSKTFLEYFLKGGYLLSLCSDVFNTFLPSLKTAKDLPANFTFGKWPSLQMNCKLPTSQFSVQTSIVSGEQKVYLGVLGTEIYDQIPSIFLANSPDSRDSSAIISQVHFEQEIENDEDRESLRLEVFSYILLKYFNLMTLNPGSPGLKVIYQNAYFLGRHELKFGLLDILKPDFDKNGMLNSRKLALKFCGVNESVPSASTNVLPILIHSCPSDFSTVEFFDSLHTEYIGRLVIYAPVVSSTMHVINDFTLAHGTAVIAKQQVDGKGRGGNQWLSPDGCCMFSLQIHVDLNSPLGSRIPLVQHLIAIAMVKAIKNVDGLQDLNIGLKWPNDIYANGSTKIGGLIINSILNQKTSIINIGCALNVSNSTPTTCLNDLIDNLNAKFQTNVPHLRYEKTFALIFNEIERILNVVQKGNIDFIYDLYYQYWLHNNQEVKILDGTAKEKPAKITGIDEYGFLTVQLQDGTIKTVHPDGNSFDMLKGLILPKIF